MKNSFVVKSLSNRIALLAFAMTLSIGATGNTYAASCQNLVQGHITWLSEAPARYQRNLTVTMVSNSASTNLSDPNPEATYLPATNLYRHTAFFTTLKGSGDAVFNNRKWVGACNARPDDPCFRDTPFDPDNTEAWSINLLPTNIMLLTKNNKLLPGMPVDCDGNLMVATHTKKIVIQSGIFGNKYEVAVGKTKFVLSFSRNELKTPH